MNKGSHTINFYTIRLVLIMLIGCLSLQSARAQHLSLQSIETKFKKYRKKDLQEKLYLQTNKDFYVAGEILWFKIFDVNGATNRPFNFSKVAYVELLNNRNRPVLQTKVSLDGEGGGSLQLPLTLHSGNYKLRAYTSWMKNFSPTFYYHQEITIVNTTKSHDFPPKDSVIKYRVNFFPEGGNLVNGLKSEVAFKETNQYGQPADFSGVVVNEHKDTLLHFHPFKFGMGHFFFKPEAGHLYQAIIRTNTGKKIIKSLPMPYNRGFVMHLQTINKDKVKITVFKNIPASNRVYLLIHTRESIKVAEVLSFTGNKTSFVINSAKLGEGISQITLFNQKSQPVCERLYFKPVKKKLTINVKTNRKQYSPRQKVQLLLSATNENNQAAQANCSVSVYKLDSLQKRDRSNILNYLWLSSDLKGRIVHSEYYFQKENDSVRKAIDNLMMTQGWRRFNWKKILHQAPVFREYIPERKGPVISGYLTIPQKHKVASGVLTYLSVPGKHVHLYVSKSNKKGKVFFNMKDFYGPHQIVVRTNTTTKDSLDKIKILSSFSDKYTNQILYPFSITSKNKDLLRSHNLWMQAEQAYHSKQRNRWQPAPMDTTPFYGKPYKTYLLDNYTRYVTMNEVLREYVMEVVVRMQKKHYHLKVMNALFNFDPTMPPMLFHDDPLVLFDGVPVFDIDKVMAYNPLNVQKIAVVAGRYFYKSMVADGIVSFTTYKGNLHNYPLNTKALVIDYNGLQRQRIFYNPANKKSSKSASRIPDFRNVLYWSPKVNTDSTGKAKCTFYTSDLPGKYLIVVNGLTKSGRAGCSMTTFLVKRK